MRVMYVVLLFVSVSLRAQTPAQLQGVQYASRFSGSDLGEKITQCVAALPASGGICDARDFSGQQAAAGGFTVGAPGKPVELMLGSVTLLTARTIHVQGKSSIVGMPAAMGIGTDQPATMIKAADGTALSAVVQLDGSLAALQDLTVDGNRKSVPGGGVGILVNKANRVEMFRVTAQNAPKFGIQIYSSSQNESCCAKLSKIMAIANGAAGLHMASTADVMVSVSEFENNGTFGIELNNAPTTRIEHCDIGGNLGDGIRIYGSSSSNLQSHRQMIIGNQFGNNGQNDINVIGSDGRKHVANGHLINSNEFIGSDKRQRDFDAIHITDSGDNTINGNTFSDTRANPYRACVYISGHDEGKDLVTGNSCHISEVGKTGFVGTPSTLLANNQ
jgi:hypothetical protein